MTQNRLETLHKFLQDTPEDPFVLYALAQEYHKLGDLPQTEAYYARLLADHPTYLATYYHCGKLRYSQGQLQQAVALYTEGIERAKLAGDRHAERELREALAEVEEE